jgi:hypothetical protein
MDAPAAAALLALFRGRSTVQLNALYEAQVHECFTIWSNASVYCIIRSDYECDVDVFVIALGLGGAFRAALEPSFTTFDLREMRIECIQFNRSDPVSKADRFERLSSI